MTTLDLPKIQRSLRELVGDGDISIALFDLKKLLPESSKKAATVIVMQSRQTELNGQRSDGTISSDDARLESNRISHDLLELINGLEAADFIVQEGGETAAPTAQMGNILYKIPSKMKVGVEKRCLVRLAFEKKTLLKDLDFNDDTHEAALRVEDEMEVYLFDPSPDDDKAFVIRAENSPRQFLEKGFFTEWIFYAKPLREGTRQLKVRAVVLLVDGTREKRKEITFESEVQVIATEPEPEPAGAEQFKSAGIQFQTSSPVEIMHEIPASSRSKNAAGLAKMIAQSVGLVLFVGAIAYFSTPPIVRDDFFAGLQKTPGPDRNIIEKYKNDPSSAAKKLVEDATLRLAEKTGEVPAHQFYLDKYPGGRHQTEVENWLKTRELADLDEIKKLIDRPANDPTGKETSALIWVKLKRFATDFGPTERMFDLLEAIKKRPELANEAPQLLEKTACLWVKSHPRPGNLSRFLRVFPKSRCLDDNQDPIEKPDETPDRDNNPDPNPPATDPNPIQGQAKPGPGQPPKHGDDPGEKPGKKPKQDPAKLAEIDMNMVWIDGGRMTMGNENGPSNETKTTSPAHEVEVDGFFMSKYEVAQAQWQAVMGANPAKHNGCDGCPVEQVSWDDVQLFLQKLNAATGKNYRLPAEAEWEFAARGGLKSRNLTLSGSDDIDEVGWFAGNSGAKSQPVGKKGANELGLFDLSGNAKEWCADPWHDNYSGAPGHSVIWEKGGDPARRVARGGSFNSPTPPLCRSTARDRLAVGSRMMTVGFRLVRD